MKCGRLSITVAKSLSKSGTSPLIPSLKRRGDMLAYRSRQNAILILLWKKPGARIKDPGLPSGHAFESFMDQRSQSVLVKHIFWKQFTIQAQSATPRKALECLTCAPGNYFRQWIAAFENHWSPLCAEVNGKEERSLHPPASLFWRCMNNRKTKVCWPLIQSGKEL